MASGGEANPEAPAAAKRAARASRCNTLFSIPMLWFMVFAAHGAVWFDGIGGTVGYWVLVLVLWAFVEGSALGLIGGIDSAFNKAAFDKHKQTIMARLRCCSIVLHFVGWELPARCPRSGDDEVGHHAGRLVAGDVAEQLVGARTRGRGCPRRSRPPRA